MINKVNISTAFISGNNGRLLSAPWRILSLDTGTLLFTEEQNIQCLLEREFTNKRGLVLIFCYRLYFSFYFVSFRF